MLGPPSRKRKASVIIPPLPPVPIISVPYAQQEIEVHDDVFTSSTPSIIITSSPSASNNTSSHDSFSDALMLDPFELSLGSINDLIENTDRQTLSDIHPGAKLQFLSIRQDPTEGIWLANISDGQIWVTASINKRYSYFLEPQKGATPALAQNAVVEVLSTIGHPISENLSIISLKLLYNKDHVLGEPLPSFFFIGDVIANIVNLLFREGA